MISDGDLERYSRQILLPEIDLHGQQRIDQATVTVVGCGGLGSMVALMLAGAGVGRLILIDDDVVEVSNLHRQLAFRESDLGVEKVVALRDQLLGLTAASRSMRHLRVSVTTHPKMRSLRERQTSLLTQRTR